MIGKLVVIIIGNGMMGKIIFMCVTRLEIL